LWSLDPGFNPQNVTSFELSGPDSYTKQPAPAIRAAYRQIHDKLATSPGIESVSVNWGAQPMGSDDEEQFWFAGRPKPAHQADLPMSIVYITEPDYLKVMQIPVKRGRFFTAADNEHSAAVAVIDESFAAKYFPDRDPIGQYLDMNTNPADPDKVPMLQIVGVVGHVNQWGLDSDAASSLHAQLYLPLAQVPDKALNMRGLDANVFFRQKSQGASSMATIRDRIHEFNSELVIHHPEDMTKTVADSIEGKRFTMVLLGVFAGLALLLASIGIYGVLSYMVGQRTREIGVRMALGAQRLDVLRMVLRDGARMTLIGIAAGVAAAIALTRLMAGMLFGVKPFDPITFASVSLLLSLVALFACYIPARSAMQVDPIEALRQE
jgi:predicted permease